MENIYLVFTGTELSFILFIVRAVGASGVDDSSVPSPVTILFDPAKANRVCTAGA
jgi:hypothetical protein